MSALTTTFRALRTFVFRGGTVAVGELLQLTDAEAQELIWMPGTIEPTDRADLCRVVVTPGVRWGLTREEESAWNRVDGEDAGPDPRRRNVA